MPKLLIKTGEKKGLSFRLTEERVTIGRDPVNSIVLLDRRVSRQHAAIAPQGKEYIIEDLGSVNGTMVNNAYVTKQALKMGDEITLGSTVLAYASLNAPQSESLVQDPPSVKIIPEDQTPKGLTVEMKVVPENIRSLEEQIKGADVTSLQKSYQRLMTLYRVSNDLGNVVDLPKLMDRILELVLDIIRADRGLIMLKDEEAGELVLQAVRRREGLSDQEEIAFSKTIANQVMQSGESILTSDAMQDARFKEAQSIIMHGIRSTMCVPIKGKETVFGIMHVDTKGKVVSFTKEDLELLTAICNQAAVAIENARLFDDLRKANQELKAQQAQLIEAERLSAVGQLASGVAHEINNPLTSILGYSELSAKRLAAGKTSAKELADCVEFLKIVEGEAHRCQRISQSLLQFARRKKDEMLPIDVNKPIQDALTIAKFHIKRVQIESKIELKEDLPQIVGDASQLQQVFLNLIINARDAMEKGGTLTITSQKADAWVEVSFGDTGCGIPEDKLDEIFKPLYTSKEEGKGTGLGLSISQDIIERHQGTIDVNSTVGKGTTFTIRLPVNKGK